MRTAIRSTTLWSLLTLAALLRAPDTPAAAPPIPSPEARRIAKLVAELGADEFRTREAAGRALEEIGAEAMPALLRATRSSNLEIRNRSLALVPRVEKRAAAYFEALGADMHRRFGTDRVMGVSFIQRDPGKLTDASLRKLVGLPWLKSVSLNNAKIGDAGMAHLGRLTKLVYLDLTGTRITDDGLAHLAGLVNVESLTLSKTPLTGSGLAHLKGMKRLQILDLDRSKLSDAGLKTGATGIEELNNLRDLIMSGTQINDDGLVCLKAIKCRIGLRLADTRITDRGLAHLRGLPNLLSPA